MEKPMSREDAVDIGMVRYVYFPQGRLEGPLGQRPSSGALLIKKLGYCPVRPLATHDCSRKCMEVSRRGVGNLWVPNTLLLYKERREEKVNQESMGRRREHEVEVTEVLVLCLSSVVDDAILFMSAE